MTVPFGHHQLHNRYRFEGWLSLDSPLRLSSGRASDETDAPLMRTFAEPPHKGVPYIPGTSLRGALRSAVERVIAATGDATGLTSCTLFTTDDCNQKALTFQREQERSGAAPGEPAKREAALAQWAANNLCSVCQLFGCTVYASRLVLEDAYPPATSTFKNPIRDGVGIDRDTGTARENVKFDYEVLEPGPKFRLRLQAENVTHKDRMLINLAFRLLRDGLFVGGKQAAGLGRIKLDGKLTQTGFANPEALWKAIQAGSDPHQDIQWEDPAC